MSLSLSIPSNFLLHHKPGKWSTPSALANLESGLNVAAETNSMHLTFDDTKERIKKMFHNVEPSVSSYDTAWVAMVPSLNSPEDPYFPECINWLLDNQLDDGSWGLHNRHPLLVKDALSSTLACMLALKRWSVGEEQLKRGLHFIKSNFASSNDANQYSPIGFDIIFPGMIEYANDMDLNLHLGPVVLDSMFRKRDLELKSLEGKNAYLAYVSEGIGKIQDWEMVIKYQRKNGSLFNSPSITAAALIHLQNPGCLTYLQSLLSTFGNAVPTVFPRNIYARLWIVDNLVRLGIDRHFQKEINDVLEMTYRSWLQRDEELHSDITTCIMAFQILRSNGYDVSPDPITHIVEGDHHVASLNEHLMNANAALELFRSSEMIINSNESALEKIYLWSRSYLERELLHQSSVRTMSGYNFTKQVEDAFEFPYYANLERLENRRFIENYNLNNSRILKTSYCFPNIKNEDFLKLAVEDFNNCQSMHREDLECLARWIVDNKLDKLKFARQKLAYCYFSAAATIFSPELTDARISWAQNAVLTTVVDDFFDVCGSEEELINLNELVEKWDVDVDSACCSDQVRIIFSALRSTMSEIGDKATKWQARNVTQHLVEIWQDLIKSMLKEAEWSRSKSIPSMDEYMENAYVSVASGPIILPTLYFIGPKLSPNVVKTPEFHNLYKLESTCGRLLNDIQGYERETQEGKLNAVSLAMIHGNGLVTEEEAVKEIKSIIDSKRRELLKLVMEEKESVVPKACKNVFWEMSKVLHLFYSKTDGFTSNDMMKFVQDVLYEPILLKP